MDLMAKLDDFQPLIKRLTNSPLKQFKSQKPVYLNLSKFEKEEIYHELQVKFLELASEFDESRGVPFAAFISSHLGWHAHRIGERLFDEKKFQHDVENLDDLEYIEQETIEEELPYELIEMIETLSQRQRQVIEMVYLNGMSVYDVAAELGVSEEAIYRHRKLGIANLKRKIEEDPYLNY